MRETPLGIAVLEFAGGGDHGHVCDTEGKTLRTIKTPKQQECTNLTTWTERDDDNVTFIEARKQSSSKTKSTNEENNYQTSNRKAREITRGIREGKL